MKICWIIKMIIMVTMAFTVVIACNPSTITGVDAAPITAGDPCTIDTQCPTSKFCNFGTVHPKKFCSPCLDCDKWNRIPKKGIKCAKKEADCGDCNPKYIEHHNYCEINEQPSSEFGNKLHRNVSAETSAENSNGFSTLFVVVTILAILLTTLISLLCVLNWGRIKGLGSETRIVDLELTNLKSSHHGRQEQPGPIEEGLPSAPLIAEEEYSQPPSYNQCLSSSIAAVPRMDFINEMGATFPVRTLALMANPTNRGNGAGIWFNEAGAPIEAEVEQHQIQNQDAPPEIPEPEPINEPDLLDENVEEVSDDEGIDQEGNLDNMDIDNVVGNNNENPGPGQQEEAFGNNEGLHDEFLIQIHVDINVGFFSRNTPRFDPEQSYFNLLELMNDTGSLNDSGTSTDPEEERDAEVFNIAVPDIDDQQAVQQQPDDEMFEFPDQDLEMFVEE